MKKQIFPNVFLFFSILFFTLASIIFSFLETNLIFAIYFNLFKGNYYDIYYINIILKLITFFSIALSFAFGISHIWLTEGNKVFKIILNVLSAILFLVISFSLFPFQDVLLEIVIRLFNVAIDIYYYNLFNDILLIIPKIIIFAIVFLEIVIYFIGLKAKPIIKIVFCSLLCISNLLVATTYFSRACFLTISNVIEIVDYIYQNINLGSNLIGFYHTLFFNITTISYVGSIYLFSFICFLLLIIHLVIEDKKKFNLLIIILSLMELIISCSLFILPFLFFYINYP